MSKLPRFSISVWHNERADVCPNTLIIQAPEGALMSVWTMGGNEVSVWLHWWSEMYLLKVGGGSWGGGLCPRGQRSDEQSLHLPLNSAVKPKLLYNLKFTEYKRREGSSNCPPAWWNEDNKDSGINLTMDISGCSSLLPMSYPTEIVSCFTLTQLILNCLSVPFRSWALADRLLKNQALLWALLKNKHHC